MKWITLIALAVFISTSPIAAQPGVNYQAAVRDAQGAIMANTNVSITITLTDGDNGPVLYQETHATMSNELGLINLIIGEGTVDQGTYASITGVQDLNIGIEAQVGDGPDIVDVGFTKVGAVPFALYGEDADADPGNEMQSLSISGDTLQISGGEGVMLTSFKSPWERTDSGYVLDLTPLLGRSADGRLLRVIYDPEYGPTLVMEDENCLYELGPKYEKRSANELDLYLQRYGIASEILSTEMLSEVESRLNTSQEVLALTLAAMTWTPLGWSLAGRLVDLTNPKDFFYKSFGGYYLKTVIETLQCFMVLAYADEIIADGFHNSEDGTTGVAVLQSNNSVLGAVTNRFVPANRDVQSASGATLFTASENGLTTQLGSFPGIDQSNGWLNIYREGNATITGTTNNELAGLLDTRGPNGNRNVSINTLGGQPNKGAVLIYGDAGDTPLGWFYVDANGQSILRVDQVVMNASPQNSNGEVISYGALLGPEQAVYDRGTAKLVNGEATIICSDHFQSLADPNTMTITITPLSAESEGVAVVEKTLQGFKVKELRQGKGNYSFDYVVTCTRKGIEGVGVSEKREASVEDIRSLLPKGPIKNVRDLVKEN